MTLKARVQKSKQLKFNPIPGPIAYSTDSPNGSRYQVILRHWKGELPIDKELIKFPVISCGCYKIISVAEDCKGNSYGTICYHCLGAIREFFKEEYQESISFTEDIFTALSLRRMGDRLIRIVSAQGEASIWAVSKKTKQSYLAPTATEAMEAFNRAAILESNTNALRGTKEEQNAID